MKTVFSVGVLVVIGVVAHFLSKPVMRLAGLPGGVLAAALSRLSDAWRFWLGVVVAFVGQAYIGLAFAA